MRATRATRAMRDAIVVATIGMAGCNVIQPELLDRTDGPPSDAAPTDSTPGVDASPDAYVPAMGNLVTNPGLETGNLLGWSTNGGSAVIALSTVQAHGGVNSVHTSGRTGNWNGPAVPLAGTIRPGKRYHASAWARLATPGTDRFFISIRHVCSESGGTESFNENTQRTSALGSNTTWVQPSSTFQVVDADDCTLTSFLVYVESEGTDAFYVDDIDVTEIP